MTRPFGGLRAWLLQPPYDGVIWLTWFYIVIACVVAGGGPFAGDLVWYDDRVRLVQILDWLNGQSWHNRNILRVNAPEGFHTLWSRVIDLPVAGIIVTLQTFLGQMRAAMVAAVIMPLLQTLLLFFAASYFARPLVGKKNRKLVVLFVAFTSCINPEAFALAGFQVGMIGHHPWYILATLMLFGAVGRLLLQSRRSTILMAGSAIGMLLLIGIEGFPLIAGMCLLIALIAWRHNRSGLALDAAVFLALGAILGLAFIPANQPPEKWLAASFAESSILGPILIFVAALLFGFQALILKKLGDRKAVSLTLTLLFAGIVAACLIHAYPQFLDGGAAALSPEERKLANAEHSEAQGLFTVAWDSLDYLRLVMPSLLAILFAAYQMRQARGRRTKDLSVFYLGLVILTLGMASIYSRYFHYVDLAAAPWLVLLWMAGSRTFAQRNHAVLKSSLLYVALGPLWLLLIPAFDHHQGIRDGVLLYPAKLQTAPASCDAKSITDFLDAHYAPTTKIIVPMYSADRFLLHTHLQIMFLANFPSQNKFIDAQNFYATYAPDEARAIAFKHNLDLVAICPQAPIAKLQDQALNFLLKGRQRFSRLLLTGQTPAWLKPVPVDASTPWLLFEVDHSKRGQ